MSVLPPDHPLASTFSVGPDARRDLRTAAARVLGFTLGERVRLRFPSRERATATVVRLSPADGEIGVVVGSNDARVIWCTPAELSSTPETAHKAPGSRASRRGGRRDRNAQKSRSEEAA